MRLPLALLLTAALLASCGNDSDDDSAAPERARTQSFTVFAGSADAHGFADVGLFNFYPSRLAVHPGDTIRFKNGSGGIPVPHTVTLGSGADIPAKLPPPFLPGMGQVPRVWGLCVSKDAVDPAATDCPDGTKPGFPPAEAELVMPPFTPSGFYNSGIFDKGQTAKMPVAKAAPPGEYHFFCYLHPATMEITVQVVAASTPTQSQQDLDGEASELIEADAADGKAAEAAATSATRPAATVQAGAEKNKAVVTRFFPAAVSIRAGEMVTWVNAGFDPHVIALGRPVGAHAPENFAPPTIPSGAAYKGGFAISGVFGHAPLPTTSYALRFPQPGNYDFFCPIHPGMSGRVQVA